ncbi:protealysin inhibitor emfourin [Ktedonospora formicarum]|uniref:Uncharacterized protein n=1 Tax=Ktedonospora formicarum TaxID=2778364 RepID=A0A8J3MU81_9CHLR|nr:protealysin inhibitor emfourin [Ktedonospora formicarum]GHO47935.1 hypothetical protein KSX_60980 [Ktedonospora formicarum]
MKVTLRTEGGLAYFPGLTRPRVLDSTALTSQEAHELEHLLANAHIFDRSNMVKIPSQGADRKRYTLMIDDGTCQYTLRVCDPVQDQHVQELLAFLNRHLNE